MDKLFCCETMKSHVCLELPRKNEEAFENNGEFIYYCDVFDEYGYIIHDGGGSFIEIYFCPWCGKKLPESQRENWVEELELLGYDEPFMNENIPQEFKSREWRAKQENLEANQFKQNTHIGDVFCCDFMDSHLHTLKEDSADIYAEPDCVACVDKTTNQYGLIVHDGGQSYVPICFCPWCGKLLSVR